MAPTFYFLHISTAQDFFCFLSCNPFTNGIHHHLPVPKATVIVLSTSLVCLRISQCRCIQRSGSLGQNHLSQIHNMDISSDYPHLSLQELFNAASTIIANLAIISAAITIAHKRAKHILASITATHGTVASLDWSSLTASHTPYGQAWTDTVWLPVPPRFLENPPRPSRSRKYSRYRQTCTGN